MWVTLLSQWIYEENAGVGDDDRIGFVFDKFSKSAKEY